MILDIGLKQFCIYTKEPKERLVRGELRLFKELDKRYDIHELKYLHDTETLNSIYVKEYDSYMGRRLNKMLHDDKILSIYDDANKMHGYEELFTYCVINKGKSLNSFLVWVGFNSMSFEGWMQFANSSVLDPMTGIKGYKHTSGAMTNGISRMDAGNPQGRFPANILVSDDMLNDGNIGQNNSKNQEWGLKDDFKVNEYLIGLKKSGISRIADKGSNSRYYNIDKWFNNLIDV